MSNQNSAPESQPVADGGGLPPLDDIQIILNLRQQVLFLESEVAFSQEALRVAREELAASKRYGIVEYRLEQTLRQERDTAETELTDLRERMQRAVEKLNVLAHCIVPAGEIKISPRGYSQRTTVDQLRKSAKEIATAAISLLSPEGSSR